MVMLVKAAVKRDSPPRANVKSRHRARIATEIVAQYTGVVCCGRCKVCRHVVDLEVCAEICCYWRDFFFFYAQPEELFDRASKLKVHECHENRL